MLILMLSMSSCIVSGGGTTKDPEKLTAPDITLDGNMVSWIENELADKYEISINGHLSYIESSITEWELKDGETFKIRAIGDGINYTNSAWSKAVTYEADDSGDEPEIQYYTVVWKNGNSVLETDTDVEEGTIPQYNGATPTKEGYVFIGWSPEVDEIYEDTTYEAQFELEVVIITYTVTFKDYDGTVLKTETVESGKSATAPADPEREGYTFAGWDGDYTNVTSNVEIIATYTENAPDTYTVTFKDHDGTVLKTETVESGKSATAPEDPTREGYTFAGWDKVFDNITEDVVVNAEYSILHNFIYSVDLRVNPGEEILIPVKILNNSGLCGFEIVITYDSAVVTPVTVTQSDLIVEGWFEDSIETATSASFSIVWSGVQNMEEDGELFIIKFIVNEEVDADFVIEISYEQENTINEDLEDVVLNCESIKIFVEN